MLVNNAANDQRYEFDQITPEQFDRTIAVNFRHVFFAAQAIVPQMRDLGAHRGLLERKLRWCDATVALARLQPGPSGANKRSQH